MEKMFINLDKYGNTSAASVPIALAEAVNEGRVKVGDNVDDRRVRGRASRSGAVDDRVDRRPGPRHRRDEAIRPEDVQVRLPVDWDSVDPIPEALTALMAQPGSIDVPDDVAPGEPDHAPHPASVGR